MPNDNDSVKESEKVKERKKDVLEAMIDEENKRGLILHNPPTFTVIPSTKFDSPP